MAYLETRMGCSADERIVGIESAGGYDFCVSG
jgi:hypothetical protein